MGAASPREAAPKKPGGAAAKAGSPAQPRGGHRPQGFQISSTWYAPSLTLMIETGLGGTMDSRV
jgi:hypothetical protein